MEADVEAVGGLDGERYCNGDKGAEGCGLSLGNVVCGAAAVAVVVVGGGGVDAIGCDASFTDGEYVWVFKA